MLTTLKTQFQKITPRGQDQLVGLLILFCFCFFSYSIGFFQGEKSFKAENPVQAAASDQHITKLLQTIQCPKN